MSENYTTTSSIRSQPSSGTTRYWCHQCGSENPIYMAPDPTCQRCNSQFIEEIDDGGDDPRSFLTGTTLDDDNEFDGLDWGEDLFQSFRRSMGNDSGGGDGGGGGGGGGGTGSRIRVSLDTMTQPHDHGDDDAPIDAMIQNILSDLLTSGNDSDQDHDDANSNDDDGDLQQAARRQRRQRRSQSQRRTPMVFYRTMVDGNMQVTPLDIVNNGNEARQRTTQGDNGPGGNDGGTQQDRSRQRTTGNNLQGILQLISALTGAPMVGNPNDYVPSQAALDNIITQLMEQAGSGTAPTPAPEDVISGLPKRSVSEQEFMDQVDCAVCKDEFNVSELVDQLPCQHLFHDDCIKPWLKVNGTCPVCRQSVIPSSSTNEINDTNETSADQRDTTTRSTDRDSAADSSFVLDSPNPRLLNRQYPRRSSSLATRGTQQPLISPEIQQRTASTGPTVAPAFASWHSRPTYSPSWSTSLPGVFPLRTSRSRPSQQDQPNTDRMDMDID